MTAATPPWHARLCARGIVGFARVVTGLRAAWHGQGPSEAPTLYFANHSSHGDFVLVWAALPPARRARSRPVAAADYWTASDLRRYIGQQVFGALLIDRDPSHARAQAACGDGHAPAAAPSDPVQAMADAVAQGDSLIMFPEGTRNTGDEPLLPLKSGLYHLARHRPELRLVPVWIENLRRVLPKGSWLPVPLACSVDFGPPLERVPGETKAEFLARARAALLALRHD
jgi:1-acyl-sn-glycerol-3-phosphate acyltransferase